MSGHHRPFNDKWTPEPYSGCWLWTGGINNYGYGAATFYGARYGAHRLSYALHKGQTMGLHVLHKCDTPLCVNPEHLFLGTDAANVADKVSKKRHGYGERNGLSKLTGQQVKAIRDCDDSQAAIAQRYGIHQSNVSYIKSGKRWGHLL